MKKTLTALLMACMMMAISVTAFAAENSWSNFDYSKYTSGWTSGGSGSGNGSAWNWGNWGGNGGKEETTPEEDNTLAAPSIGECRYIHQTLYAPDCLVVSWSEIEGAETYEVEMCDSECNLIKTYIVDSARISICAIRDDSAVMGCIRGRKIRVRAIDADGNAGKWSEYSTCQLPRILHLKKLILCSLHKMSFFLSPLQLSDQR